MTFYLLALSILLVFMPFKLVAIRLPLWCCSALVTVLVAYLEEVVDAQGLLAVLIYTLMLLAALFLRPTWLRRVFVVLFGVLSLLFAMHVIPGFYNHAVVVNQVITPDALPYSLYANFDKGLVGLFLIGYFFNGQIVDKGYFQRVRRPKEVVAIFLLTPCVVLGMAVLLGLVRFDFKVPSFWLSFMAINLFFTCVAEEVFFRGFLQRAFTRWLDGLPYQIISPILSALLFGVAHIAGGVDYAIVASVAGFGYAYLYHRTNRIELSILCHFFLNLLHFFFFTYPMLG